MSKWNPSPPPLSRPSHGRTAAFTNTALATAARCPPRGNLFAFPLFATRVTNLAPFRARGSSTATWGPGGPVPVFQLDLGRKMASFALAASELRSNHAHLHLLIKKRPAKVDPKELSSVAPNQTVSYRLLGTNMCSGFLASATCRSASVRSAAGIVRNSSFDDEDQPSSYKRPLSVAPSTGQAKLGQPVFPYAVAVAVARNTISSRANPPSALRTATARQIAAGCARTVYLLQSAAIGASADLCSARQKRSVFFFRGRCHIFRTFSCFRAEQGPSTGRSGCPLPPYRQGRLWAV